MGQNQSSACEWGETRGRLLGHQFFPSFCQSRWREAQERAYIAPGSVLLHQFTVYEKSLFFHQNNTFFFEKKKNRRKKVPWGYVFSAWLGTSYRLILCPQGLLLLGPFYFLIPTVWEFLTHAFQDLVTEDAGVAALP